MPVQNLSSFIYTNTQCLHRIISINFDILWVSLLQYLYYSTNFTDKKNHFFINHPVQKL